MYPYTTLVETSGWKQNEILKITRIELLYIVASTLIWRKSCATNIKFTLEVKCIHWSYFLEWFQECANIKYIEIYGIDHGSIQNSCWCNPSTRQYSNCKAFSITPPNRILCPDNKDRRRRILSFSIHHDESVSLLSTATIISRNTYTLLTALTPPNDTFQQRDIISVTKRRLVRKIEHDRYRTSLHRSLKSVIKHRIYIFFPHVEHYHF